MKRRTFVALLGCGAFGPAAAWAEQTTKPPLVGFFHSAQREAFASRIGAFNAGLEKAGFVDGRNVVVDYRFAEGRIDQLAAIVRSFVEQRAAVLCAGNVLAMQAARSIAAARSIPTVFLTASDPVKDGFVTSFNEPGGNATGIVIYSAGLIAKRLHLLHDMVPAARVIGLLVNPTNPTSASQMADVATAAANVGIEIETAQANTRDSLATALATLTKQRVGALLVGADPFLSQQEQLVEMVQNERLPASFEWQESVAAGGLMSYGTNLLDAFSTQGNYAGRILGGAKPSNLPVWQQTNFELVINLRAAKQLGLTVPPTLLAQATALLD